MHLMVWSTDAEDAKMLLDILFSIDYVIVGQLGLNLVNICLDNTLQIFCKSFLCLPRISKIDHSKSPKF